MNYLHMIDYENEGEATGVDDKCESKLFMDKDGFGIDGGRDGMVLLGVVFEEDVFGVGWGSEIKCGMTGICGSSREE
ncbi:hypothetical protein GH714_014697 [Hevea brasiliensis]|uniref:Uncharacterized protein n=1 Tax=Hevea brasiliensis TaxID=3981 RepID=A0A6A6KT42_HEVBR|nr:hypothetical protein GH714_014697 [Hevea brasiliensis]